VTRSTTTGVKAIVPFLWVVSVRGDMTTVRLPLVARRLRYAFVAVVAAVVLVSSISRPGATGTATSPFGLVGADKWLHAFVYAALAAAIAYASVAVDGGRARLAAAVFLAIAFGIAIELIQWPIPYRTASTVDTLADAVGACVLALAWWSLGRFVRFVPVTRWTGSSE
jgi:VanZ family protein